MVDVRSPYYQFHTELSWSIKHDIYRWSLRYKSFTHQHKYHCAIVQEMVLCNHTLSSLFIHLMLFHSWFWEYKTVFKRWIFNTLNNDKIIYIQSIIVTQPLPNFDFCEIRYNLSSRYRLILQKIQMDSRVKELEFIIHGLD